MSADTASQASQMYRPPRWRPDAIVVLASQHREIEDLFEQYDEAPTAAARRELAEAACHALAVHAQLEEELLHPACVAAGLEPDLLEEAALARQNVRMLIGRIVPGHPEDGRWEEKVTVLRERFEHDVDEEEGHDGLFAHAARAAMDLQRLGDALTARRTQLTPRQA